MIPRLAGYFAAKTASRAGIAVALSLFAMSSALPPQCLLAPAWAGSPFAEGVQAYNQRNYILAMEKLAQFLRKSPGSADGNYYLAATYAALGRQPQAKQQYEYTLKAFPGTRAAKYSLQALAHINDNKYLTTTQAPANIAADTKAKAASPQEDRIPLRRGPGGHLLVRVRINGHPLEFAFDTGAGSCAITQEAWKRLGYDLPTGAGPGKSKGVGGEVSTWSHDADIEMGRFKRHLPLTIVPSMPFDGLVGQTFFQDLQYDLSGDQDYIHIYSGGAQSASRAMPMDTIDVPFTRDGNNIVVNVRINGRPLPMVLDTGAANTVVSAQVAKDLGIKPNGSGEISTGVMTGVGGGSTISIYNVDSIALGPIEKQNISIWVGGSGFCLLGQNFLSGRRYIIDNEKSVIHFTR